MATTLSDAKRVVFPLDFQWQQKRLDNAEKQILSDKPGVLKWLKEYGDSNTCLIDIGANLGIISALCLCWGYTRVLAVEPLPANFLGLMQLKNLNPDLCLDLVYGACIPSAKSCFENTFYDPLKIVPTTGSFIGASWVKPEKLVENDRQKFSSIVVPSFTVFDLLTLISRASSPRKGSTGIFRSCIIKIDVDSIDFEILLSLIKSGVASFLKAVIVEISECRIHELISLNLFQENFLEVVEVGGSDILIMPVR